MILNGKVDCVSPRSGRNPLARASCPLCASQDHERRFVEAGHDVLRCGRCDLLFIDPYPLEAEVRRSVGSGHGALKDQASALRDRYAAEVAFFNEHFKEIFAHCAGAKSLLEVGCGTGRLLELMRDAGLDAEGVELDPARAEAARDKSGCVVHVSPVENLQTGKQYDVVTLINVLSHIPSLTDLFEAIKRLMDDQGRLIIMAGEMRGDVERGDAQHWAIPIHMHFLGLSTIEYICSKFGFRIVHRERTPYAVSFFSEARFKAPGRSRLRNLIKSFILRLPFIMNILRWNYDRKRAGRVFSSLVVLAKAIP